MLLFAAVFLFNVMCYWAPCDMHHKPPEILQQPKNPLDRRRNERIRQVHPVVKTPNGVLEGYFMKAMNGRLFMAFEGIPYGRAGRWELPRPAKPWHGIRQVKKPGSDCLQLNDVRIFRVWGQEDCLYANVYTPQVPNASKSFQQQYPVVVFMHGGAFQLSSGADWGPTYLMSEDVILVTFNYRLGVLGFLSTGDEVLPGNFGLKDQALLLQWVHQNIEHFGGMRSNISIWGQSAGAVSVHLHLVSEKTRNYFSTAFASSGSAFQHWAVQSRQQMRKYAHRLAKNVGCESESSQELVNCLKKVNVNLLVARQMSLTEWYPFPPVRFSPTVEPDHPDSFLTVYPAQAYQAGTVAKKPLVIGTLRDEGQGTFMILLPLLRVWTLRRLWSQIAPTFLQLKEVSNHDAILQKIGKFYFRNGLNERSVDFREFGKMITDRYFHSGIVQGIQAHASSGAPTYGYLFSFSEGKTNLANFIGYKSEEWGVGHTEDTLYLFNCSILADGHKQNDPDHQLSSLMINLLVNFARTGQPQYRTPKGNYLDVWLPTSNPSQPNVLQLDRNIKMIPLPKYMVERLNFWSSLNVPNMTLWSPLLST